MGEMFLDDGDIRLYHGDVLEVLAGMPDESVDCVVTSPPYWGLRDYGTGAWDGGDPDCDHQPPKQAERTFKSGAGVDGRNCLSWTERDGTTYRDVCPKCGARRVDQQLGLEPTPDLFVANMVAVFREVKRVLAAHGTCWVNLGDSYANGGGNSASRLDQTKQGTQGGSLVGTSTVPPGLKQKDLVGIPWHVALALQADGWYLRADIIWAKPNPMPESVTDRPTKSHEYVFLLTKQPRYFFDQEAVREPADRAGETIKGDYGDRKIDAGVNGGWLKGGTVVSGRNVRSVWQIATQPYPEAHFATYPEELVRRCVLAGCPVRVCRVCGAPSERIVERESLVTWSDRRDAGATDANKQTGHIGKHGPGMSHTLGSRTSAVGWSDCGHNDWRPGVTLDPFVGSGTTCKVARDHGRHSIGIDLSADYLALAARRLQQLSLLT